MAATAHPTGTHRRSITWIAAAFLAEYDVVGTSETPRLRQSHAHHEVVIGVAPERTVPRRGHPRRHDYSARVFDDVSEG